MDNNNYIDFHCHPGLKTFLTADTQAERTPCTERLPLGISSRLMDQFFLSSMLWSNSSLKQLVIGGVKGAVVGLYAYEEAMIRGRIKRFSKIRRIILSVLKFVELANRMGNEDISGTLLRRLSNHNGIYLNLFKEVEDHLYSSVINNSGKYKVLKRFSDWDPLKLNIILSIEGGHNLFSKDKSLPGFNDSVLKNLADLKSSGKRYWFIALMHMEQTPLCTHAYGLKIIEDDMLMPAGDGISALGKDVIRKALEKNPYRMYIDVKHMSLWSRLQFYKMLKEDETLKREKIPIIMSHAGITGVSYNKMLVRKCEYIGNWFKIGYFKKHGLMRTDFNPWSINLYDEEIQEIIDSDGIIGINLDERILGTKQHCSSSLTEYLSDNEFYHYMPMIDNNIGRKNARRQNKPFKGPRKWFSSHRDIKYLCNSILHIVEIGGEKAWDHICIGSDFDGMVNPIDYYPDSTKLEKLHKGLLKWLPKMADWAHRQTLTQNQTPAQIQAMAQYYYISNIETQVNGIMYENVSRFMQKYFQ